MDTVFQQFIVGLSNAMLLFLIAAGLSLIFGITRIINFAHGSLYMVGAYLAYAVSSSLPESGYRYWIALLVAPTLIAILGALIEVTLLRRIYRSEELYQLVLTVAISLIVSDAVRAIWGAQNRTVPRPDYLTATVTLLGANTPIYYLVVIALGPLVGLGLAYIIYRTRWGILVRAARDDREMAAALGVDQAKLFLSTFTLGSWLAGFGGALAGLMVPVSITMDLSIIIEAFVVVVVGGLGSFAGAFLAALLIGQLKAFAILVLPRVSLILVFALMAVILIFRPWGLLGQREH